MANLTFASTPLLGVNFDYKRSSVDGPAMRVGTVVMVNSDTPAWQGKFAMYVHANGAISALNYVTVDLTSISVLASSVDGGAGTAYCQNGSVAFADGEYGWVIITRMNIFQK